MKKSLNFTYSICDFYQCTWFEFVISLESFFLHFKSRQNFFDWSSSNFLCKTAITNFSFWVQPTFSKRWKSKFKKAQMELGKNLFCLSYILSSSKAFVCTMHEISKNINFCVVWYVIEKIIDPKIKNLIFFVCAL